MGKCEECKWWVEHEITDESEGEGNCHRYPPNSITTSRAADELRRGHFWPPFPVTCSGDFCGEYQDKEKK